jgi:hypothetical protein
LDFNPVVEIGDSEDEGEQRLSLRSFRSAEAALQREAVAVESTIQTNTSTAITIEDNRKSTPSLQTETSGRILPSTAHHAPVDTSEPHVSALDVAIIRPEPNLSPSVTRTEAKAEIDSATTESHPAETGSAKKRTAAQKRSARTSDLDDSPNTKASKGSIKRGRKTLYLACPICARFFSQHDLARHAANCVDFVEVTENTAEKPTMDVSDRTNQADHDSAEAIGAQRSDPSGS